MASTVWKGYISFGLVSVPVRLFAAAREEHVSFNQIHGECGGRIKQQIFCPQCDRVVERNELQKGYEVEKGTYVTVTPDELKGLEAESSDVMEIQQFVSLGEVDPIFFETSYYSAAEESGKRAYNLLFRGMTREKLAAIARVTLSGREQVVLIRPYDEGLLLHTLYYPAEVREVGEYGHDTASEVPEQEVALAEKFMESLRAPFAPEQFQDNYKEKVLGLIETKRAGQAPRPGAEKRRLAPVVDLMTALKQSLAEKERTGPTLVPAASQKTAVKKEPQHASKEAGAKSRKKAVS
jgi:DNA end-binding protein Ku